MQQRFSPNRQGAHHILDVHDVVIVQGTPVQRPDTGSRDSRIRISRNGYAERALWVSLPVELDQPGLQHEFHLWNYRLEDATIAQIDASLATLVRLLRHPTQDRDPNDTVRSIRFWHAAQQVECIVKMPDDPRLMKEQCKAFQSAWYLIDAAVPAHA